MKASPALYCRLQCHTAHDALSPWKINWLLLVLSHHHLQEGRWGIKMFGGFGRIISHWEKGIAQSFWSQKLQRWKQRLRSCWFMFTLSSYLGDVSSGSSDYSVDGVNSPSKGSFCEYVSASMHKREQLCNIMVSVRRTTVQTHLLGFN